jgi:multicomponent Na+:H+ antiporter subunit D
VALHKKNISTMNGIGRKMPFTMSAFFIGSLCIIGVPPMGGSWSKWYLAMGAIDADRLLFVVILMISSLLSIAYLMPVVVKAFFLESSEDDHHDENHGAETPTKEGFFGQIQEAPLLCVVPLCLTALGCIGMFFGAPYVYNLIESITKVS